MHGARDRASAGIRGSLLLTMPNGAQVALVGLTRGQCADLNRMVQERAMAWNCDREYTHTGVARRRVHVPPLSPIGDQHGN